MTIATNAQPELARRILAAEDHFSALGCEVRQEGEFMLVTSDVCPDRFDANHVRCIDTGMNPPEFIRSMERLFSQSGRTFCAFATDMRTKPAALTLVLREADYAPEPGVIQVLGKGSRRRFRRRPDVDVVRLTANTAADWAELARRRYDSWDLPGIAERAAELDWRRLQAASIDDGGCVVYLAYERGQAVGCIEVFFHDGIARLDRLFVLGDRREAGIGATLMAAAVADARRAAETVCLVAASYDWPRYYYLRKGFVDLTEVVLWRKSLE